MHGQLISNRSKTIRHNAALPHATLHHPAGQRTIRCHPAPLQIITLHHTATPIIIPHHFIACHIILKHYRTTYRTMRPRPQHSEPPCTIRHHFTPSFPHHPPPYVTTPQHPAQTCSSMYQTQFHTTSHRPAPSSFIRITS